MKVHGIAVFHCICAGENLLTTDTFTSFSKFRIFLLIPVYKINTILKVAFIIGLHLSNLI